MRNTIIIFGLILSGCAHDNYTVIPNSNGSQDKMAEDLHICKKEAIHAYWASKPDTGGLAGAAGVLGGAIGGAIVGLATSATEPDTAMKSSDINPYIENCMKKKGYEGTST